MAADRFAGNYSVFLDSGGRLRTLLDLEMVPTEGLEPPTH